jgi:predicted RNase H-like nuclease
MIQAFHLLPKIRQVDDLLQTPGLSNRIREVHPEVSFALWNDGQPMRFNKKKPEGRRERERLIDREWPGERERLARLLRGSRYAADDLNDAFAALWSSRRIAGGKARAFPCETQRDSKGLPMRIEA